MIYRFIDQNLFNSKYDIKHFNLRELLLVNYESFLRAFFEERIYQDSKLKKTSEFMEVGYLQQADVMDWLDNLDKYSKINRFVLNDRQREAVWDFY